MSLPPLCEPGIRSRALERRPRQGARRGVGGGGARRGLGAGACAWNGGVARGGAAVARGARYARLCSAGQPPPRSLPVVCAAAGDRVRVRMRNEWGPLGRGGQARLPFLTYLLTQAGAAWAWLRDLRRGDWEAQGRRGVRIIAVDPGERDWISAWALDAMHSRDDGVVRPSADRGGPPRNTVTDGTPPPRAPPAPAAGETSTEQSYRRWENGHTWPRAAARASAGAAGAAARAADGCCAVAVRAAAAGVAAACSAGAGIAEGAAACLAARRRQSAGSSVTDDPTWPGGGGEAAGPAPRSRRRTPPPEPMWGPGTSASWHKR